VRPPNLVKGENGHLLRGSMSRFLKNLIIINSEQGLWKFQKRDNTHWQGDGGELKMEIKQRQKKKREKLVLPKKIEAATMGGQG